MSLKSNNSVETNIHELVIEVDAKTFAAALNTAYRKEVKNIALPGFRKGKAPRAMIEKIYGKEVFYDEALREVYPAAVTEAINESKLAVVEVMTEEMSVESIGADGVVFKVKVVVKPEVTVSAYKGLEVTKMSAEVSDEDINEELKRVQMRNSRLVTVEDRAAEMDDVAVIDFEGFVDGVAFPGGKGDSYSLTLGSGQFIPGFEEQIVGHNVNDAFDVNVTFPTEYQAAELAGKDATFKVVLHELKARELPELDDELAKDVSEFDTLDEYKADLKKTIGDRKAAEAEDDLKNQIIDKLIDNTTAEIPEVMFEQAVDNSINDFSYRLSSQGLDIKSYLQYTGMDEDGMRASFRPQAERQVKLRLALEKIAAVEAIVPTADELNAEYAKIAESYKMDVEKVKVMIAEEDLALDVAVEKAMNLVVESAAVAE